MQYTIASMPYADASQQVLRVDGLRVELGGRAVVDDLSLTAHAGEVVALLGPNGAGKTTTINVVTTLLPPAGGTVQVAGHDVVHHAAAVRRAVSVTGQYAAVDERLTGRENLVLVARLLRMPRRAAAAAADRMLERLDLVDAAHRRVGTWSGGMRRRLDIAASLLAEPRLLVLDEPTTGLDPRSRRAVWDLVRAEADRGVAVLLTTQYLEEADQLADRIAVLHAGRVAALGTAAQLKARVGTETLEVHADDGALLGCVPTDGTVAGLRRALDELDTHEGLASLRRPSLDDVFLTLTEKEPA